MPVTNLVWLTSSSETFTPEDKAAMAAAFDAQAAWVAANVPSALKDRTARGVGLFQQVEDPRVVMESAHWTSSDEHNVWLASPEYQTSSAPLGPHFDFSKLEYFHLDDAVFASDDAQRLLSTETTPFVEVARIQFPSAKKDEASALWEAMKPILIKHSGGGAVCAGWRVQKVDEETDELVMLIGWQSVEDKEKFEKHPDFEKSAVPMVELSKSVDIKLYKKIM